MSVIPLPEEPDAAEPRSTPPPTLRLVTEHEHVWQLRAVEYDDALEVRRYECAGCDDVMFR